jgi:hypothetical protein
MAESTIKCPKCHLSKLLLTEVVELRSSHMYEDGKLTTHRNEEVKDVLRYEASCINELCKHKWTLKRDISFADMPMDINTHSIIEYNCVTCGLPKKLQVRVGSKFNPETDECIECKLGITELKK